MPIPRPRHKPIVEVECVVLGITTAGVSVLLVSCDSPAPLRDRWTLPCGAVEGAFEDIDEAAYRVLEEKTGIGDVTLEQVGAFGDPTRDPRGNVIGIAYMAHVDSAYVLLRSGEESREKTGWFDVEDLPLMAYDHDRVVRAALSRLRAKMADREREQESMSESTRPTTIVPPPPFEHPQSEWFANDRRIFDPFRRTDDAVRYSQVALFVSVLALCIAGLALVAELLP
jgi:ADP-ribose pyrophosphatase YjhB (NUDIX family)